jgi:HEAT repeat protein
MIKLRHSMDFVRLLLRMVTVGFGISRPLDLIQFLSNPDQDIRWSAADALSTLGDASVVEPVFELLQIEPDPHVRKRLVWVLERGKAWDKLFLCLDSPKREVSSEAVVSLSRSGQSQFVVPLLEQMKKYRGRDRTSWLILRGIVDKTSVGPLLESLSGDSYLTMRRDLLDLLGRTRDQQVFDVLVSALNDEDEEIRSGAVSGLVSLGDIRAIEPLQNLLADPSEDIRTSVKVALEHLEKLAAED